MNKKKEKEISEYLGLMLWPGFCRRWRQRRRAEGERESREMVKQGTEMRKTKKKRKWAPLNKKIIYGLPLVSSAVSNMRLHCSSIVKIIPFKTFDGASFWVKNAIKKKKDF